MKSKLAGQDKGGGAEKPDRDPHPDPAHGKPHHDPRRKVGARGLGHNQGGESEDIDFDDRDIGQGHEGNGNDAGGIQRPGDLLVFDGLSQAEGDRVEGEIGNPEGAQEPGDNPQESEEKV